MALKYGIPPGNPTVVWDDDANGVTNDPYISWQMHLNRTGGARGGVDMTARWAPLYAPIDCRVEHYGGGAGTAVRMWATDGSGWSDVFDHMSAISVPNNAIVPFGGRVGTSGDTGAAGAPHLHWHRLDPGGVRKIPWDYFTDDTTTPTDPVHPGRKYPKMRSIMDPRDQRWWAIGNGDPSPFGDNILEGGVYVNPQVFAFQHVWGPGVSGLTDQAFLDTVLTATPVTSPSRPAVAMAATPAQRANAAQAILNSAMAAAVS